jgi:glycosyltransferase involved in cell wall biosynthesis
MRKTRVAIICDYPQEGWPSMDLVGEMLSANLSRDYTAELDASRICPHFVPVFSHVPLSAGTKAALNADRLINRMWHYPRYLRELRNRFDLFHVVDHSYSQLVSELPAERTIVTCHDLDAFRCLFEPEQDPRPKIFRTFMQRILEGFGRAARVVCDSYAVRDELLAHRLVSPERVTVVHNGVDPACSPGANRLADAEAEALTGRHAGEDIRLLHVGSTAPRKRIDLVLRILAAVRRRFPGVRLIRCGGELTSEQRRMAEELAVADAIDSLPFLSKSALAAVYRRATMLLLPSEREGFGLPLIESMACGTPVIASDLPVLREVGGQAAAYCPVGDTAAWAETVAAMLTERSSQPEQWRARREAGISRASEFSWTEYAKRVVAIYRELIDWV